MNSKDITAKDSIAYAQLIAALKESEGGKELIKALKRQRRHYREMTERIDLTDEYRLACAGRAGGISEVLAFIETGVTIATNPDAYLPREGAEMSW